MSTLEMSPATADEEARRAAAARVAQRFELPSVEFNGSNWVEKPVANKSCAVGSMTIELLGAVATPAKAGRVFGADQGFQCYADAPKKYRKPDVSFVSRDRLPVDWASLAMMPVPADLAVEVISPDDLYTEIRQKIREYLAADFGTVWVIDPENQIVEVHRIGQRIVVLRADDEITGDPFLPAFRCKVAAFFE